MNFSGFLENISKAKFFTMPVSISTNPICFAISCLDNFLCFPYRWMRLILRDRKSLMPFVLLLRIRQLAIQIGSSSFASPDYSGFALRGNVRIYSLISSASCMRSINAGIIRTRRSQDRHATHVSCLMQNRGTRENA